ncbi:hypothetical protein [Oscillibacter sp.]|uniref:hypothetical protein n=1 Tax=Oscillibacter sp. TaxID=1945593 RepID=UPI0026171DF6|nr:hypothetical protein [Oscillibacter sp.]MDD3347338.1 hypothetical protein [Oscillibacter sp.]
MATKNKPVAADAEPVEIKFSKAKLLTFKRYRKRVDLLATLLKDGVEYTLADVDSIINDFMKGRD